MRHCEACNIDYDTQKFCKKCGAQLVETKPIVKLQPLEQQVENKKQVAKTGSKGKKIILLLLLLVITILGGTGFYFTTSKLDVPTVAKFDKEEFVLELLPELFSSTDFSVTILESAINELLSEIVATNKSQYKLLGSEISDLVLESSDQELFIQFSNGILKSTAVMTVDFSNIDNKLICENKGVRIGRFKLPILGSLISNQEGLSEILSGSYEFPKSVKVEKVKLVKDGLEIEGEFDMEYLHDAMIDVFEYRKADIQAIGSMTEDQLKILDLMNRINELNEDEVLNFFFSYFNNDEFASSLLATIKTENVQSAIDTLSLDLFELSDDQINEIADKSLEISENYDQNAELELFEKKKAEAIKYASDVIVALNKHHEEQGKIMHLISYNGMPYSTTLQQLISASSFNLPSNESALNDSAKIFIKGTTPYVCLQTDTGCIVSDGILSDVYADYSLAKAAYGFADTITIPTNSLLPKGNSDRTKIAEVTSKYINSKKSIFIKYLKSDGTWAFLMCTPGSDSQDIKNIILKKTGGTWQVVSEFDRNFTNDLVDETLRSQGFNVTLLPPYEYGDFLNYEVDSNYISSVNDYLYSKGKIGISDKCDYLSKVETIIVTNFVSGKRFILEMKDTNHNEVINVVTLQKNEHFVDYSYILENHFGRYVPSYVFLQN